MNDQALSPSREAARLAQAVWAAARAASDQAAEIYEAAPDASSRREALAKCKRAEAAQDAAREACQALETPSAAGHSPSKLAFHFDRELSTFKVMGVRELDPLVHNLFYGWAISSFEWEITIHYTTRQDGKTSWAVTIAEVDGAVKSISGLSPWNEAAADILKTVNYLTQHWINPIQGKLIESS